MKDVSDLPQLHRDCKWLNPDMSLELPDFNFHVVRDLFSHNLVTLKLIFINFWVWILVWSLQS